MSDKREVPEFRDRDDEHLTGCVICENKIPEMTDPGFVICKIYRGKIRCVVTGCPRHYCSQCVPLVLMREPVYVPLVLKQETFKEALR